MLYRGCPLLAHCCHMARQSACLLCGVNRTSRERSITSANDPKRSAARAMKSPGALGGERRGLGTSRERRVGEALRFPRHFGEARTGKSVSGYALTLADWRLLIWELTPTFLIGRSAKFDRISLHPAPLKPLNRRLNHVRFGRLELGAPRQSEEVALFLCGNWRKL